MKLKIITTIVLFTILVSACGNIAGASLDGTSWELVSMGQQPPITGSTITIAFEDGQVKGNSGCNSYGGEYKLRGDKIEFGMLMSTLMVCVDTSMVEQESAFMRYLGEVRTFELADRQLQLIRADGEALTFVPR